MAFNREDRKIFLVLIITGSIFALLVGAVIELYIKPSIASSVDRERELSKAECGRRGMGFVMKAEDYALFCHDRTTRQVYYFNLRRE